MYSLKFGEKIKAKRRERELTQEELANILGVTKAAVSKWENDESYPDITTLPQIAQLFNITMDELFEYTLEYKPLKIVTEYNFGFCLDNVDRCVLDHCTIKECRIDKYGHYVGDRIEYSWDVFIRVTSQEEDFPYILQKHVKQGAYVDGTSARIADGKIIYDDKPNKHFVCREKIWEYNAKDIKHMRAMLKEMVSMGLIKEDEL